MAFSNPDQPLNRNPSLINPSLIDLGLIHSMRPNPGLDVIGGPDAAQPEHRHRLRKPSPFGDLVNAPSTDAEPDADLVLTHEADRCGFHARDYRP